MGAKDAIEAVRPMTAVSASPSNGVAELPNDWPGRRRIVP